MSDPTVVKIEPPVATALGECKPFDVVGDRTKPPFKTAMVVHGHDGDCRLMYPDGTVWCDPPSTPVLLVARVQLEGRGK